MAEILSMDSASSSSGVSAISWLTSSGAQETRVYYQDDSGNIRERQCSNGSWTPGNGGQPITRASPGSRISANYWYQQEFGGDQIRLYYTDSNGRIEEYCYSEGKGWFSGVTVIG